MIPERFRRHWPRFLAGAAPVLLGGCDWVVMNPAGDVARQQADIILISTGLMLLIIVPVMILTVVFAWKYRAANRDAEYKPDWDHSTGLELIIWSGPLLIVIALGALTWISTHLLDPYRPLNRIHAGRALAGNDRPLEIQVVSMDWKWAFIYPEQGVATINALVIPKNRQVRFRLTSTSVMNTFYVPTMAGMIYTMPGMETKLHAVLNRPGRFEGISANYSGAGFSDMRFKVQVVEDDATFDRWAQRMRGPGPRLDTAAWLKLERPSEKVPMLRFNAVEPGLFDRVVNMCVRPGSTCMSESMRDGTGHGGHAVNSREHPDGGKTPGALQRSPEEKGSAPHSSAPTDDTKNIEPSPGRSDPGNLENRNMTRLAPPAQPGRSPAAQV